MFLRKLKKIHRRINSFSLSKLTLVWQTSSIILQVSFFDFLHNEELVYRRFSEGTHAIAAGVFRGYKMGALVTNLLTLKLVFGTILRSSHRRCSIRKGVLRNFAKFTWKHLCQSLFFDKVARLSLQLYLKRDSGTGVFTWILQNF